MALAHGHHITTHDTDSKSGGATLTPTTAIEAAKERASRRLRSHRSTKASDAGVWTASLFLGLIAGLMPAWFIGSATLLQRPVAEAHLALPASALTLLSIGALATLAAARCAVLLTHAPRVERGSEGSTLRWISIATAGIAVTFVLLASLSPERLSGGVLSAIAAACPAIVMGVLCHEMAVAAGRHGAGRVAHPTCAMWIVLGGATAFAPLLFEEGGAVGPLATLSACAALLTAFVSVRTWYRNEGYAVTH